MTKFLVALEDQNDARIAFSVRADIVLLSGTLQKIQKLCSTLRNMPDYFPQIWVKTSNPHLVTAKVMEKCGANRIVVSASPDKLPAFHKTLVTQCSGFPLVASMEAGDSPNNSLIPIISALGFSGILLQPRDMEQTILSQMKIENIGQFMEKSRASNLEAGVLGMIEAPDIPRLLPYSPDWLGFVVRHPIKSGQFGDDETNSLMRALLPFDSGQEQSDESVPINVNMGINKKSGSTSRPMSNDYLPIRKICVIFFPMILFLMASKILFRLVMSNLLKHWPNVLLRSFLLIRGFKK